jgi:hypothetical protein
MFTCPGSDRRGSTPAPIFLVFRVAAAMLPELLQKPIADGVNYFVTFLGWMPASTSRAQDLVSFTPFKNRISRDKIGDNRAEQKKVTIG